MTTSTPNGTRRTSNNILFTMNQRLQVQAGQPQKKDARLPDYATAPGSTPPGAIFGGAGRCISSATPPAGAAAAAGGASFLAKSMVPASSGVRVLLARWWLLQASLIEPARGSAERVGLQDCLPRAAATKAKSSDKGKSQALYNNVQPRPGRAANDDCLPQLSQALRTGRLCGTV